MLDFSSLLFLVVSVIIGYFWGKKYTSETENKQNKNPPISPSALSHNSSSTSSSPPIASSSTSALSVPPTAAAPLSSSPSFSSSSISPLLSPLRPSTSVPTSLSSSLSSSTSTSSSSIRQLRSELRVRVSVALEAAQKAHVATQKGDKDDGSGNDEKKNNSLKGKNNLIKEETSPPIGNSFSKNVSSPSLTTLTSSPTSSPSLLPVATPSAPILQTLSTSMSLSNLPSPLPSPTFSLLPRVIRVFVVARWIPLKVKIDEVTNVLSVEWEDERSFLANIKSFLYNNSNGQSATASSASSSISPSSPSSSPSPPVSTEVHFIGIAHPSLLPSSCLPSHRDEYIRLCAKYRCHPIFVPTDIFHSYLDGFCRGVLWPLLHYSTQKKSFESYTGEGEMKSLWESYEMVNYSLAQKVISLLNSSDSELKTPNPSSSPSSSSSSPSPTASPTTSSALVSDFVWIHNFYCFLVPSTIRMTIPKVRMGLFIHTPFPSSDVFRVLPFRSHLMSSVMCVDLIGFHTFDYARHFLSTIKRVLDADFETLPGGSLGVRMNGRVVELLISHVGINSAAFRKLAIDSDVISKSTSLRKTHEGKMLILGVDDLDIIKGPQLKFLAYDRLLKKFPDLASSVHFVQIFQKSPNAIKGEGDVVRRDVMDFIDKMKIRYGDNIITILEMEDLSFGELVSIYSSCRVAVITSLWDGLNLTPFEFTASQSANDPGALVVSEFCGCSRSLNGVLRVNPWSVDSTADALHRAITMTIDERKANHIRRFNYTMAHDSQRWAKQFIETLERASATSSNSKFIPKTLSSGGTVMVALRPQFTQLDEEKVRLSYKKSQQRIFFLDYDGTLADSDGMGPEDSTPSPFLVSLLRTLCADPHNSIFVMSGRSRSTLFEWFGEIENLGLAAEKGLFIRWPKRFESCRKKFNVGERDNGYNSHIPHSPLASPILFDESSSDDDENDWTANSRKRRDLVLIHKEPKRSHHNVSLMDTHWDMMGEVGDLAWKVTALEILKSYSEQTDGSWIEDKEFSVVWHFEQCDPEYGRMQANEMQKFILKVCGSLATQIDVIKYEHSRIVEVKPHGVSKGLAAISIAKQMLVNPNSPFNLYNEKKKELDFSNTFILACGDDLSDEEMFEHIHSIPHTIMNNNNNNGEGEMDDDDDDDHSVNEHNNYISSTLPSPLSLSMTLDSPSVNVKGFITLDPSESSHSPTPSSPFPSSSSSSSVNVYTVTVGCKPSKANFFAKNVQHIHNTLQGLAKQK